MYEAWLLLACIMLTLLAGWSAVFLLTRKQGYSELTFFEILGLSYLFGIGIISIEMFILGLFDIKLTRITILIPWIPVIVISLLKILFIRAEASGKVLKRFSLSEIVLIMLIGFQVLYTFFKSLIRPIESYDSVAIYGLKAKVLYLSHGVIKGFFEKISADFIGGHPDYPLLVPLSETWVYTFLGKLDDYLVKAIFPLFFLSFIFIFYAALKRMTQNRTLPLLFTFAFASIKHVSDYAAIGYADLELGIYFAVSLIYLYFWFKNGKGFFLNISLVSSILCLWTKNEGSLLCLMILFALGFYVLSNIKKIKMGHFLHAVIYIFIVLFFIGCWSAFKSREGLINENFNLSMVTIKNFMSGLNKIPAMIYGYQREFFGFKKWNLAWIIFLAILFTQFKHIFTKNVRDVTITLFLFAIGYALMYMFSSVEIKYFVRITASRFLLHILPAVLFWQALVIKNRNLIEGFDAR